MKINSTESIPLSMSVLANRYDVVTIGSYESELQFDDYNNQIITIPISSVEGEIGETILTVTLSYGSKSVTRTIYLNVYP